MLNLEVRKPVSEKVIFEPVKRSGYEKSRQSGEQVQSPKMGTSMVWVDTDFHWKE